MTKQYYYRAILQDDEGSVLVTFPDIPEAITCGDNETDAITQARDCLDCALRLYVEDGKPFPEPSKGEGVYISPSAEMSAKLFLLEIKKERNLTDQEIADKAFMKRANVTRLFSMEHRGKVSTYEKIFYAYGYRPSYSLGSA